MFHCTAKYSLCIVGTAHVLLYFQLPIIAGMAQFYYTAQVPLIVGMAHVLLYCQVPIIAGMAQFDESENGPSSSTPCLLWDSKQFFWVLGGVGRDAATVNMDPMQQGV